ncbi:threonine aldolase family protein [Streptomyces albus]|uniref:threonine aldolase family protein n=1 Tax=Streptomyces sp. NRRL F-5917 TaxID=1463873 RepID=UPI0004BFA2E6|nr:threonine aldolase family protein [Streptomyces sp. NRRL F-5917]
MPAPIDLRSDTLSVITPEMRRVMADAEVGDDLYGGDPTTRRLESHCAELLGKEAALFTASGTLSNQLALRGHTRRGSEVITDTKYHLNFFESAATADLSGVVLNPVDSPDGVLTPALLDAAVDRKRRVRLTSAPSLVWVENTVNYFGGSVVRVDDLAALRAASLRRGLPTHMDGARLPNASVATGTSMAEYAAIVDTVAVSFAKALGAPFGSVLAGPADLIEQAATYRLWYGGGLHQSGFMAAAALHALENNVDRLAEDHAHARLLRDLLVEHPGFTAPEPETNMVLADISGTGLHAAEFAKAAAEAGVQVARWTDTRVRLVTRLGVEESTVREAVRRLHRVAERRGALTAG